MKIVIIGNGIAGTSAARTIRKHSDHDILMISDESYQPFSRTALMYVYMGHLKEKDTWLYEDHFWSKNRIRRLLDRVMSVDVRNKTVLCRAAGQQPYDLLIIASGSVSNTFGWPGQNLKGVQGLYHLQDVHSMESLSNDTRHAVVVGGGLIGIEMVEMLLSRGISVSFLVREKSYWNSVLPKEESAMINRHLAEHRVDLHLETELASLLDDGRGRVGAVQCTNGKYIPCQFVGLTVGVRPNIDFLNGSGIETRRGVLVDEYLNTNIPDVFAVGDCAELRNPPKGRRAIEAVWYSGRTMGQTLGLNICGEKRKYDPGIWFNSAKFFDIEYQVYGEISPRLPDHREAIYWEHPSGKKSIRIEYDRQHLNVVGFNLMGIRFRHEVCEQWIKTKALLADVVNHLSLAHFDPEFYPDYHNEIIDIYNVKFGSKLKSSKSASLNQVLSFLNQT